MGGNLNIRRPLDAVPLQESEILSRRHCLLICRLDSGKKKFQSQNVRYYYFEFLQILNICTISSMFFAYSSVVSAHFNTSRFRRSYVTVRWSTALAGRSPCLR